MHLFSFLLSIFTFPSPIEVLPLGVHPDPPLLSNVKRLLVVECNGHNLTSFSFLFFFSLNFEDAVSVVVGGGVGLTVF
jgi:hypothetical protein